MLKRKQLPPQLLIIVAVAGLAFIVLLLWPSQANQATKVVNEFYKLEQQGRFSSSWELLHPEIQGRFPKPSYIQDRAHVFMSHFGADSFTYSLSSPNKKRKWKITNDAEPMDTIYNVTVTKSYRGKYGKFYFKQEVYVAKEEREWKIMWDYKD
ncbi:hypothetical protein BTR23_11815 [Alkalihalophilus pseudofirmus]|nr:hypothetical protein BTR23_11815 [Alkalihalophilus pseudofirmus]